MAILSSLVGTCAGSYRNLMGRAVKVGGPAGGLIGMMADLGAPVANFALYFVCGSALITTIAGFLWFGKRQRALRAALADGRITQEELSKATETNGWSVTFAFGLVATCILGLVFAAQALTSKKDDDGPDRGVLATVMPALQKVQDSLFNIERKVEKIETVTSATKEQTGRIESKTEQVLTKLDDMSRLFEEASKKNGIIAHPESPAEHYHNARFAEVKADFPAARQSYSAFLAAGLEFIDPCLAYTDMIRTLDGLPEAREVITALRNRNQTLSLEAASTLLQPKEARAPALKKLLERMPEFAPAAYLLSREYSAEKLGEQTIDDKKEEKAALTTFRELDRKGKFQKYILDKREGIKWLADADARFAKLAAMPDSVLNSPVTITPQWGSNGWIITLSFAESKVKSVSCRLDGQGEFQDTGTGANKNPNTGLPMPNLHFNAGVLTLGDHTVEVRYVDMNDKTNGPFKLSFNPLVTAVAGSKNILNRLTSSWVSFGANPFGKPLLYFSSLLSYRGVLKTIRYSLDSDEVDKTLPFKPPGPGEDASTVGEGPVYIEVPATTKSACVQLEFIDGTLSEKKTFQKP